jgi:hypothetical protein
MTKVQIIASCMVSLLTVCPSLYAIDLNGSITLKMPSYGLLHIELAVKRDTQNKHVVRLLDETLAELKNRIESVQTLQIASETEVDKSYLVRAELQTATTTPYLNR